MAKEQCPFEEGDRVDHKICGFGTVNGPPVAMVGPNPQRLTEIIDRGWMIPVRWDDPARTSDRVDHSALTKVSSPDARPFTYWDRQWQPLLKAWLAARRAYEDAAKAFRPLPAPEVLAQLRAAEESAYAAMEAFKQDEREGRH